MDCPFCDEKVIKKQLIYETDLEFVLHNIKPAAHGHCLVIPKMHVTHLGELDGCQIESLFTTVSYAADVLKVKLFPFGFNYGFNEGEYAGQMIKHFHVHIIPRHYKDNIPEYHLFHRDPRTYENLKDSDLAPSVQQFRRFFGTPAY